MTIFIEEDDWELWQHAYLPEGTRLVILIFTWSAYQDRLDRGDCDVL